MPLNYKDWPTRVKDLALAFQITQKHQLNSQKLLELLVHIEKNFANAEISSPLWLEEIVKTMLARHQERARILVERILSVIVDIWYNNGLSPNQTQILKNFLFGALKEKLPPVPWKMESIFD